MRLNDTLIDELWPKIKHFATDYIEFNGGYIFFINDEGLNKKQITTYDELALLYKVLVGEDINETK